MQYVAELFGAYILKDRHRALLVSGGKRYVLDKDNTRVHLSASGQESLKIRYDGLKFLVEDVRGAVAINNMAAGAVSRLPGSSVIVLGAPEERSRRTMVTVDVSHPEVGL